MHKALNTKTGQWGLTAPQIIAANPHMIFPVPFELPDDHVWYVESFPPAFDPATHRAVEVHPVEIAGVLTESWVIEPLTAEEVAERVAALEGLRAQVRAGITAWRDLQEAGGFVFEHAGRSWDGGKAVRDRLQPMLDLPALPPGFFWTDADDNDVEVTPEELADLYVAHQMALITKGFEIHVRQREMKAAIETMTMAQLQAFVPGWTA